MMILIFEGITIRPPNMPRRTRIAVQQNEQDEQMMDSPQRRQVPPVPLQFNNPPAPAPNPVSLDFFFFLLLNAIN